MTSKCRTLAVAGCGLLPLAMGACASGGKDVAVRPIGHSIAPASGQPAAFRLAEANGHLALGNVGLALEIYRKALREAPDSVPAMVGLATCYDLMGRFDLSRRHYEMALAEAPSDARLYAALAGSLDLQGRSAEAASVRGELAQRIALVSPVARPPLPVVDAPPGVAADDASDRIPATVAAEERAKKPSRAANAQPIPVARPALVAEIAPPAQPVAEPLTEREAAIVAIPVAPPEFDRKPIMIASEIAARSVTILLDPPAAPSIPAARSASAAPPAAPRLERMSLGEVALVTAARPLWRARLVEQSAHRTTIAFVPQRRVVGAVLLLNAARSRGLAAHSRASLAARGWRGLVIGDAPRVSATSSITYPAAKRSLARRLALQFRIPLRHLRSASGPITISLGRDAARRRSLEPVSG